MKTAIAAAPRTSAKRKATNVREGARPEEYWVVIGGWMLGSRVGETD